MELMDALVKRGWTPEGAAIAAGNARAESDVMMGGRPGDNGISHDLMQWNKGRWADFKSYATNHPELTGIELRAAFIDREARGHGKGGYSPGMWSQHDLSKAGHYSHSYEGFGDSTERKRVNFSAGALKEYQSRSTKITISKNPGANPTAVVNAVAAQ